MKVYASCLDSTPKTLEEYNKCSYEVILENYRVEKLPTVIASYYKSGERWIAKPYTYGTIYLGRISVPLEPNVLYAFKFEDESSCYYFTGVIIKDEIKGDVIIKLNSSIMEETNE